MFEILRVLFNMVLRFGLMKSLILVIVLSNIFVFLLFLVDKHRAITGKWRISERVLVFFTLCCGIGASVAMWVLKHKTKKPKFKIAAAVGIILALIPIAHIAHGLTLGRVIRFVEVPKYFAKWPQALDGYRIAFMADIHMIPHEDMRGVIEELNDRNIDLLLLGGDFSTRDNHYLGSLAEIANLVTTDGIFGVEGNHDDYVRLFGAMESFGMLPLDNSGLYVREGFFVAGVSDKWNRQPCINTATSRAGENSFVLLVSHNPDVTESQSTEGIDLILSGHTHGGQITFFGYPFYLHRGSITNYGTNFAHGLMYTRDGAAMYVTSGVGMYYNVPRMFTRPEVVIFTMRN